MQQLKKVSPYRTYDTADQGKVTKWLPFKNYKSESPNIVCINDVGAYLYQM